MDQAFGPNTKRMSNSCQRFHTDPKNKLNPTFCQTVPSRIQIGYDCWLCYPRDMMKFVLRRIKRFNNTFTIQILYSLRHHSPVYIYLATKIVLRYFADSVRFTSIHLIPF